VLLEGMAAVRGKCKEGGGDHTEV